MKLPQSLIDRLTHLSLQKDDQFDLLEAALIASKILKPSQKIETAQTAIHTLSDRLMARFKSALQDENELDAQVSALHYVMIREEGFHGDEEAFDDLDHLNLFSLLEQKCGTALSLSILYIHCAQTCGWNAQALNFPAYSLICLSNGAERVILDPFHGCTRLDAYNLRQIIKVIGGAEAELTPQFYETLSPKTLAMRYINSIKAHFLRCQQMEPAVEMLEALCLLENSSPTFWRERGLLLARIGLLEEAVECLQNAQSRTQDSETFRQTQFILDDLLNKISAPQN